MTAKTRWKFVWMQVLGLLVSMATTAITFAILPKVFPEMEPMKFFSAKQNPVILTILVWAHEIGHRQGFNCMGIAVKGPILFLPFGGFMVSGRKTNPREAFISAIRGPATGLIAIPLYITGSILQDPWIVWASFLSGGINLLNLIPIAPLDGGHVIASLASSFIPKAHKWVKVASAIILMGISMINFKMLGATIGLVALMWGLDALLGKVFQCNSGEKRSPPPKVLPRGKVLPYLGIYLGLLVSLLGVTFFALKDLLG